MRASIETTTRNLPYSLASAWRYRCTFCGRHHGDRDSAALHAVVCGKNPQGMPRGVAFVRDTDSGVLYASDAAREAAAAIKPRRVLVARYVCKYCRGSFASISGIAAHEAKCEASPAQRGCLSCRFLIWEVDGLGYPSAGDPYAEAEGELPFCEHSSGAHELIHYGEPGACHGRIRTAALRVLCADWAPKNRAQARAKKAE